MSGDPPPFNPAFAILLAYGILTLFGRLRRPKPIVRKTARLEPAEEDHAATAPVTEVVDTSGGPLRPGHLRRVLRDPRLLPKPEFNPRVWPRPPKPKYMDFDEATRVFSGTLRTRNRQLRDLLEDVEQLRRHGLPEWKSEADIAEALGISVKRLRHFSIHRPMERVSHYVQFAIPKRTGGERLILAPKKELKRLQRRLNELLVNRLPVSEYAHGFRIARSIATHAAPHVGNAVVVKLDLKNFFPSIHVGRVRGLLIALGYSYPVAATLATLMTESERQPVRIGDTVFQTPVGSRHTVQGAPTSPGLANSIVMKMDHRLAGVACQLGFAYTRYADDLAFSGNEPSHTSQLIRMVHRVVHQEGFSIHPEKTRIMKKGRAQVLTGVTVNTELGLSRKKRRLIRAALHNSRDELAGSRAKARARGWLAFVGMLNRRQASALGPRQ